MLCLRHGELLCDVLYYDPFVSIIGNTVDRYNSR